MEITQKIQRLEDELKLLKNEVHQTLLDIKDSLAGGFHSRAAPARAAAAQPAPQAAEDSVPSQAAAHRVHLEEPLPRVEEQRQVSSQTGGVEAQPEDEPAPQPRARQRRPDPSMGDPGPGPRPRMDRMPAWEEGEPEQDMDYVPAFVEYRPSAQAAPRKGNGNMGRSSGRPDSPSQIDLATLATLGNWADRSARKIGRERVEAVLEVYQITGYLPRNMKDVLLKLLSLDNAPVNAEEVSLRDCITVLMELNGIVVGHTKTEAAMLSLLTGATERNNLSRGG